MEKSREWKNGGREGVRGGGRRREKGIYLFLPSTKYRSLPGRKRRRRGCRRGRSRRRRRHKNMRNMME